MLTGTVSMPSNTLRWLQALALLGVAAGMAGCTELVPTLAGGTLPSATVGVSYRTDVGGGSLQNPQWQVATGALPPGLSLTASGADGGVISGTPTTPGTFSFGVTITNADYDGSMVTTNVAPFTLVVANPPLAITSSATLPQGTAGAAYSYQFTATGGGGAGTYLWSTSDAFPTGLSLSPGGMLGGAPTQPGAVSVTVTVASTPVNGALDTISAAFALDIEAATLPLTITSPATLPEGFGTVAYGQPLTATGGSGSYQWSVTSGGLPAGLSLTVAGLITGTPTALGTATFTAQVTSGAATASQAFTIQIGAPLTITTLGTLPEAVIGHPYSVQLVAAGGVGGYSWTIIGGALPPGVSLASSGLLTGSVPVDGTLAPGAFTLQVTSGAETDTGAFTLVENVFSLQFVSTSPLPTATVGIPYTVQFVAAYGQGPGTYHFRGDPGAHPGGLTLNDAGILSGTPQNPSVPGSSFGFSVQVRSGVDSIAMAFTLAAQTTWPPVAITSPPQLPNAETGVPYAFQLMATGGPTGTYTWTDYYDPLPSWLSISTGGLLSGTPPIGAPTPVTFTVAAYDIGGLGAGASMQFYLTIAAAGTCLITTPSFDPLNVGFPADVPLSFTPACGTPSSNSWTVTGGTLPAGLQIEPDENVVAGYPTAAGPYSFTLNLSSYTASGSPVHASQSYSGIVGPETGCAVGPVAIPSGAVSQFYSVAFSPSFACTNSTDDVTKYSWTISAGSLPPGLGLPTKVQGIQTTGVFGTPTSAGTYTFTVTFTNTNTTPATTGNGTYSLTIN